MIALTVEPDQKSPETESPEPPRRKGEADLSLLEDKAPEWARVRRSTAALAAGLAFLFALFSFMPLWHTDVWGHLSYGRWIAQHGALPATEPLLPLCEGMRFVDTAWLSQVAGYFAEKSLGITSLQFLFAASVTFCLACLAVVISRRTQSNLAAFLGVITFLIVDYQQLIIARPQMAGLVAFVAVLSMLTTQRWRPVYWFLMPAVFALWANLHGSFPMGLALVGCYVLGRAIDLVRRTGSTRLLWRDATLRRRFLLLQLSAVAVLLNPYGLGLYLETVRISANPNLQDLLDWEALTLRMSQGKAAALALVALMAVLRMSPRRMTAAEAISLTMLGLAACYSSRIIVWWGPVCAYSLAIHFAAIWQAWKKTDLAEAPRRTGLATVAMLGIVWIAFAYSPFGMRVLHGAPKDEKEAAARLKRSVSLQTPIAAAEYLKAHPPVGQCFNTYEYGDYLLWDGPPGAKWFVASHAHLVPREVWTDYLRIVNAAAGWEGKLDRYGVNTIVLDRHISSSLVTALMASPDDWKLEFQNDVSAIFVRKKPV